MCDFVCGACAFFQGTHAARQLIEHAAGYAVFSSVGIKLLFAGGQQGKGMVINNRTHRKSLIVDGRMKSGGISQRALRTIVTRAMQEK